MKFNPTVSGINSKLWPRLIFEEQAVDMIYFLSQSANKINSIYLFLM